MAKGLRVEVYEQANDGWKFLNEDLEGYLGTASKKTCFMFVKSESLQDNHPTSRSLHAMLQNFYRMPSEIWSNVHWESNGYYGCSDGESDRHDTWFRFLVKQLFDLEGKPFPQYYDYDWDKMGFFTTWSKDGPKNMLCMDCPEDLVRSIRNSLDTASRDHFLVDPYSFHQIVVRSIVNLFDKSIWKIRDVVRQVEKAGAIDRVASGLSNNTKDSSQTRPNVRKPAPDYDHLHEAARHVIHSTETLIVSTQLVEQMMLRQRDRANSLVNAPEEEKICMRQIGDNLMFYHGMLHAFKCRSESMQARHQNEISLAFNTVAQYHSQVAVVDAAAMRVIAALTAAFLPATFVSAIFSMSFFNNGGGNSTSDNSASANTNGGGGGGGEGWSLSDRFWIYWAFAVPLTVVTIVLLMLSKKIMRYFNMI